MVNVKVRKTGKKPVNPTLFSLMVESHSQEEIAVFDVNKITDALILELGLNEKEAGDVTKVVTKRIHASLGEQEEPTVDTALIRAFVNVVLYEKGYNKKLVSNTDIIIPSYDITQLIENANQENGNMEHNPESINFTIAERVIKEYTMKHLITMLTPDVANAHLQGNIHIHDAGSFIRAYAFDGKLNKVRVRDKNTGKIETLSMSQIFRNLDSVDNFSPEDGVHVKTYNGYEIEDKDYTWTDLDKMTMMEEKKDIYEVELENGTKLYLTEEHPCIVVGSDGIEKEIPLRLVQPGDMFYARPKGSKSSYGRKWEDIYSEDIVQQKHEKLRSMIDTRISKKGLSYEEIYSPEEAARRRERLRSNNPSVRLSEESKKSKSEKLSKHFKGKQQGENNNFYGKKHSHETRQKLRDKMLEPDMNKAISQRITRSWKQKHNQFWTTRSCKHCGKAFEVLKSQQKDFCNNQCAGHWKLKNGIFKKDGPNSWEQKICNLDIPDVQFVGDHSFWITLQSESGNTKYKNPDFILTPFSKTKKAIEVWGNWWHKDEDPNDLKTMYNKEGIDVLILQDHDIKKSSSYLKNKIERFINE